VTNRPDWQDGRGPFLDCELDRFYTAIWPLFTPRLTTGARLPLNANVGVGDPQRKRQSNRVLIDADRQSNLGDTIGLAIVDASVNHPAWPLDLILIDAPFSS
jgi:hypothetical protein